VFSIVSIQVRRPPSYVQGASLKGWRGITACLSERRTSYPRGKGTQWQRYASAFGRPNPVNASLASPTISAPGPDGNKRRCTKTFPSRKEANAWLAHTVVEIKQGVHTPAHRSPTVAVAGEAWITQAETDGLERAAVRQYRQHLNLHIKPFLGHHKSMRSTHCRSRSTR